MTYLSWTHFDKHEYRYMALCWTAIYALHAWVNSASVLSDYHRLNIAIEAWKPIVWESSSHLIGLMLIPLILIFDRYLTQSSRKLHTIALGHLLFSVAYSVCHVAGMVLIRQLSYSVVGDSYDFGNWFSEWIYEYRKDVVSYMELVIIIYAYRFIISRLRGEATVIAVGENNPEPQRPERFLVRKIDKEFIIRVNDIDWIDAAGNYMNLNLDGRSYPLRETMLGLESKLDPAQFVRIHRSTMVNLDKVDTITPLDSGDYEVTLSCGKVLRLSRRYRDKIKQQLN
jgi:hypothetical protein